MCETSPCPECGEEILAVAIKCRYCGVALDKEAVEAKRQDGEAKGRASRWPVLARWPVLVGVVLAAGACLYVAIPNLIPVRKGGGETRAIGALRTIGANQSLFREADKEKDGNLATTFGWVRVGLETGL